MCVLGDLSIIKGKGVVNPRLQFLQGACNFEYLMHLYDIFQTYCGTPGAPKVSSHYNKQTGKRHGHIGFNTLSSPIFLEFNSLFYKDGVKFVPAV
jgi:hypothetical protein